MNTQLLRAVRELPPDTILQDDTWHMAELNPVDLIRTAKLEKEAAEVSAARMLYRLPTVAQVLDTPLETIKMWVRKGRLPKVKRGRSVYVTRADLIAFVERLKGGWE